VSTRWATTALCTLAVAVAVLFGAVGTGAATARPGGGPVLTLVSQTPWITPTEPWFDLALAIGPGAGPASGLHVSLAFYARLDDSSQLQQAIGGSPPTTALLRLSDVPVVAGPTGALTSSLCVTVLPDTSTSAPAPGPGACPEGSPTLTLDCTPLTGRCGDVYPVGVALLRQGSSTPVARFTTFLTYQEPGAIGEGGPLRVGVVVPVTARSAPSLSGALSEHRDVATTLAVNPTGVNAIERTHSRDGQRALNQLSGLSEAEVLDQSFVPINVAGLSEAGLAGEIGAQVSRGDQILRAAGFKVAGGPWVDTVSTFAQGDADNLASGLQIAGASQLVLGDDDLATGGLSNYTFAQPFTLDLGHGSTVAAVAADSVLSNRFTAQPADPVLGAQQLLAALDFVHFENAFLSDPRGVVVDPPAGWRPSGTFLATLLAGLSGNPALSAVTLDQLFAQVPVGGNREPAARQLQAGPAGPGISRSAADRIALGRQQLSSYTAAVDGHPPELTILNDALLATEARGLSPAGRTTALAAFDKAFASQTGAITLATERTVTFTAQRAAIPVTVLSGAPYPVRVVVTLDSDKFTFPNGNTRQLLLDRPTTSVRVTAQARTSGDRLPIEVTLHTPDGQLVLAHTVLTVQSTAISFVGVALTVLAGAVLLAWWVRTWRRSRRARPRAH
jgi:uncharacterized protein DUF6049